MFSVPGCFMHRAAVILEPVQCLLFEVEMCPFFKGYRRVTKSICAFWLVHFVEVIYIGKCSLVSFLHGLIVLAKYCSLSHMLQGRGDSHM